MASYVLNTVRDNQSFCLCAVKIVKCFFSNRCNAIWYFNSLKKTIFKCIWTDRTYNIAVLLVSNSRRYCYFCKRLKTVAASLNSIFFLNFIYNSFLGKLSNYTFRYIPKFFPKIGRLICVLRLKWYS